MIWLTWRQLRAETIALAVLLTGVAAFVVATGIEMRGFGGGIACLGTTAAPTCGGQGDFNRAFGWLLSIVGWFNLLPLFLGVFIGAPTLARELERGTHRLAWTQSITRTHWLLVKLGGLVAIAVAFGALTAGLLTWWRQPWDLIDSPFASAGFDFEGLIPAAHALFALTLGVAVGALIRRTVPAMAITVAAFLAARLPIEFLWRPHYMTPLSATSRIGDPSAATPAGAWVLDSGLVDAHGNPVYASEVFQTCGPDAFNDFKAPNACVNSHGWLSSVTYQPLERFWPFQFIETAIFVALSAALVALTVVWVRRRLR